MNTQRFSMGFGIAGLLVVGAGVTVSADDVLAGDISAGELMPAFLSSDLTLAQATLNQTLNQVVPQAAQSSETDCRQVNTSTGVYMQPSLESASRGVLATGQTIRLEMIGTGTGWARITEPMIGWVEAKYLTPAVVCNGIGSTNGNASSPMPNSLTPTVTRTTNAVCQVLPSEGLVVRSNPEITNSTALYTIPKGAHQFQFTDNYLTTRAGHLERRWTYITAPYQGWISLGVVGGSFNLGGSECG